METVITKSYQGAQTRLLLPKVKDVAGVIGDNNSTRLIFKLPKAYNTGWVKYIEFDCEVDRDGTLITPSYLLDENNSATIPLEVTEALTGKEVRYNLKLVSNDGTVVEKSEMSTLYFRDSSNGTNTQPAPYEDIISLLYNNAFCNVAFSVDATAPDSGVTVPQLTFTPLNTEGEPESVILNMPYLDANGHIPPSFIDKEIVVEIFHVASTDEMLTLTQAQIPDMALLSRGENPSMDLYMLIGNDPTSIDNWYLIHTDNPTFGSVHATSADFVNTTTVGLTVTGDESVSGNLSVTGQTSTAQVNTPKINGTGTSPSAPLEITGNTTVKDGLTVQGSLASQSFTDNGAQVNFTKNIVASNTNISAKNINVGTKTTTGSLESGAAKFTGDIDATGKTITANTFSGNATTATTAQNYDATTGTIKQHVDTHGADLIYGHVKFKTDITSNTTDTTISEKGIKDFVNSSINAVAAYYITYNAQGDRFPSAQALRSATTLYSGGEVRVPTRNDYAVVVADETHPDYTIYSLYASFTTTAQYVGHYVDFNNAKTLVTQQNKDSLSITPGTTVAYERIISDARYIYAGTGDTYDGTKWEYNFPLGRTFTNAEVLAIDSGITAEKVEKLDGIAAGAQVNVLESVKINGSALTVTDKAVDIGVNPSNPTLAFGQETTIGTIAGQTFKVTMPANPDTDAKTTSSDKKSTKLFLVGAEVQSSEGQTTYSNEEIFITTGNKLHLGPLGSGSISANNFEAVSGDAVNTALGNYVTLDTGQTISGAKTFSATETKVNEVLTFTNTTNPRVTLKSGNNTFYLQASDNKVGIGPGWDSSTKWDTSGNMTVPQTATFNSSINVKNANTQIRFYNANDLDSADGMVTQLLGYDSKASGSSPANRLFVQFDGYRRGASAQTEAHWYIKNKTDKYVDFNIIMKDDNTYQAMLIGNTGTTLRQYNPNNIYDIVTIESLQASTDVVHTSGNEDVYGNKTFINTPIIGMTTSPALCLRRTNYAYSDISSDLQVGKIYFQDKTPTALGEIGGTIYKSNGLYRTILRMDAKNVNNNTTASLAITANTDGKNFVTASYRSYADAGSDEILVKAHVTDMLDAATNVVHTTGNEDVGGIKKFSAEIRRICPNIGGTTTPYDIMRGYSSSGARLWEMCSVSRSNNTTDLYFNSRKSDGTFETVILTDGDTPYDARKVLTGNTGVTLDTSQNISASKTFLAGLSIGSSSNSAGIEIFHETPFIDFHHARSILDNTARIINNASGQLTFNVRKDDNTSSQSIILFADGYVLAPYRAYNSSNANDVATIGTLNSAIGNGQISFTSSRGVAVDSFTVNQSSGKNIVLPAGSTQYQNQEVTFSAQSPADFSDYPYMASLSITGLTADMYATATFSESQVSSGQYAPFCQTVEGAVRLYAKSNVGTQTIPTISVGMDDSSAQQSMSNFVTLTGGQTIGGAKTFTSGLVLTAYQAETINMTGGPRIGTNTVATQNIMRLMKNSSDTDYVARDTVYQAANSRNTARLWYLQRQNSSGTGVDSTSITLGFADTGAYFTVPYRTYNTNNIYDVVTIGSLQASTDVVHRSGDENIDGTKTVTGTLKTDHWVRNQCVIKDGGASEGWMKFAETSLNGSSNYSDIAFDAMIHFMRRSAGTHPYEYDAYGRLAVSLRSLATGHVIHWYNASNALDPSRVKVTQKYNSTTNKLEYIAWIRVDAIYNRWFIQMEDQTSLNNVGNYWATSTDTTVYSEPTTTDYDLVSTGTMAKMNLSDSFPGIYNVNRVNTSSVMDIAQIDVATLQSGTGIYLTGLFTARFEVGLYHISITLSSGNTSVSTISVAVNGIYKLSNTRYTKFGARVNNGKLIVSMTTTTGNSNLGATVLNCNLDGIVAPVDYSVNGTVTAKASLTGYVQES